MSNRKETTASTFFFGGTFEKVFLFRLAFKKAHRTYS